MHPTMEGGSKLLKPLLVLLVVVIVVAGAYAVMKNTKFGNGGNTQMKVADNNKGVPTDFPKDLFVDSANILQSNTLTYPDKKITLSSISFKTFKQAEELYTLYGKFLQTNKYQIMNQAKSSAQMTFNATKDKNDLSIVITPDASGANVQISFVTRQ